MNAFTLSVLLQTALGSAAAAALALRWGYPLRGAAWHGLLLLLWAGALGALLWPWRRRRAAWAAALALGWGPLLLLYFGHWATHTAWGNHLTWRVLGRFLPLLPELLKAQGLERSSLPLAVLCLLALLASLGWAAGPALARGLEALRPRLRALGAAWLLLALAWSAALAWSFNGKGHGLFSGEPVSSLWLDQAMTMGPARLRAARADLGLRQAYRGEPRRSAHVVLIVCDGLRWDRMSLFGYPRATTPFLDSLARDPRLWRAKGVAVAPNTNEGVMGILASREAPRLGPGLFKLNELLSDQGWRSRALISGDGNWQGLQRLLGRWDQVADGVLNAWDWSTDDALVLRHLEQLPPPLGRPELLYLHLLSTHTTGYKDPAFARWQPAELNGLSWQDFFDGKYDAQRVSNRYDNGVLQADAMLAQIWRRLEAQGRLQDAIVVITADHGEALGEEGRFGHSHALDPAMLRVPLLIWDSRGRCCGEQPRLASQLDLAPTIARSLGLEAPASWQGHPLQAPLPSRQLYVETPTPRPLRALLFEHQGALWRLQLRGSGPADAQEEALLPWDRGAAGPAPPDLPGLRRQLWRRALFGGP